MIELKTVMDLLEIANRQIDTQALIIKAQDEKIAILERFIEKAQL